MRSGRRAPWRSVRRRLSRACPPSTRCHVEDGVTLRVLHGPRMLRGSAVTGPLLSVVVTSLGCARKSTRLVDTWGACARGICEPGAHTACDARARHRKGCRARVRLSFTVRNQVTVRRGRSNVFRRRCRSPSRTSDRAGPRRPCAGAAGSGVQRLLVLLVHRIGDRGHRVQADQVGELERAHRVGAAQLHAVVDAPRLAMPDSNIRIAESRYGISSALTTNPERSWRGSRACRGPSRRTAEPGRGCPRRRSAPGSARRAAAPEPG